ncbi:hypothetical protein [Streptomyces sp. NPDC018610]|uniref:hypothetical protein n=1 Tax=Streptomyces sp. NPDC018610 TaxID=3365049 RepID=UPI0037AFEADD
MTLALAEQEQKMPSLEELRPAFRWVVIPKNSELDPPEELDDAYGWISKKSLLVSSLEDLKILRHVQYRIPFKLDGPPRQGTPPVGVGARSTRRSNTSSSAGF